MISHPFLHFSKAGPERFLGSRLLKQKDVTPFQLQTNTCFSLQLSPPNQQTSVRLLASPSPLQQTLSQLSSTLAEFSTQNRDYFQQLIENIYTRMTHDCKY